MPIRFDNVTNATIYTTDGTTATTTATGWVDHIVDTEWATLRAEPYTALNFNAADRANVDIYDVASRIAKYLVREIEEKIGIDFDEEKLEEFLSSSFKED